MSDIDAARSRVASTYNAAADHYDDPANAFWARFGRSTVERLKLERGSEVLDVCCGSGASAIPAAERVGPSGCVLGIDLAEQLLELARAKATARGLSHAKFQVGDMLAPPPGPFDVVICVFGIFFVPDMAAAVRALWSVVRPGGSLAITTWGPRFFEPASSVFWRSVQEVRPDLFKGFHPWDRITERPAVHALFRAAGIHHALVDPEAGWHPIPTPEAWWSAVLGSGYRGTVDQLSPVDRERVRTVNLDHIRTSGLKQVEANVVYATAHK